MPRARHLQRHSIGPHATRDLTLSSLLIEQTNDLIAVQHHTVAAHQSNVGGDQQTVVILCHQTRTTVQLLAKKGRHDVIDGVQRGPHDGRRIVFQGRQCVGDCAGTVLLAGRRRRRRGFIVGC